jgi:hypothetical protein
MSEQWRVITWADGYELSSDGRCRVVKVRCKSAQFRGRLLKPARLDPGRPKTTSYAYALTTETGKQHRSLNLLRLMSEFWPEVNQNYDLSWYEKVCDRNEIENEQNKPERWQVTKAKKYAKEHTKAHARNKSKCHTCGREANGFYWCDKCRMKMRTDDDYGWCEPEMEHSLGEGIRYDG